MTVISSDAIKPKKLLIITSSGGGGLIQTANAKEQEALARDPNLVIVRRDLLKDWVPFGPFFINFWNKAQQKGKVSAQIICVKGQFIWDFFLFPSIFINALYTIFKEDIDYIIDTQPLGTSAIVKALRLFNKKRLKNARLEKVLVDLPTKQATHFFGPIKRLNDKERKVLQLTTIAPLLESGETPEQFWQATCGLSEKEINCEDVYVRKAFQKYKGKVRSEENMTVPIEFHSDHELSLIKKSCQRGGVEPKVQSNFVEFQIAPNDFMITILLGSQPAAQATLSYVKQFASLAKEFSKSRVYLFAFCANHIEGKETLFKKMGEIVSEIQDYPKNLVVVPFPFQKENVIARLFHRSDMTCTRSGGQTAMELMCVATGEIWIHSEAKEGEDLLSGIPGWEAASATYLETLHGAKIVTPYTFAIPERRLFDGTEENLDVVSG